MPERVKLLTLREYVSASGNSYFAGFLGDAKVVMLKDGRATCTGNEIGRWDVFVEPKPQMKAPAKGAPNTPLPTRQASAPTTTGTAARAAGKKPASAADEPAPWE